jgi:hypothetical protein
VLAINPESFVAIKIEPEALSVKLLDQTNTLQNRKWTRQRCTKQNPDGVNPKKTTDFLQSNFFSFFWQHWGLNSEPHYHLSHSTSPFLWMVFPDRVSWTMCYDPPDLCLLST